MILQSTSALQFLANGLAKYVYQIRLQKDPRPHSGFAFRSYSMIFAARRRVAFLMSSSYTSAIGGSVDITRRDLNATPESGRGRPHGDGARFPKQ